MKNKTAIFTYVLQKVLTYKFNKTIVKSIADKKFGHVAVQSICKM